jgi:hypothetical protein
LNLTSPFSSESLTNNISPNTTQTDTFTLIFTLISFSVGEDWRCDVPK